MLRSKNALEKLAAANFLVPEYDRSKLTAGVVHIGVGNFARAHLLRYIETVLEKDLSWGVRGLSVTKPKPGKEGEPSLQDK